MTRNEAEEMKATTDAIVENLNVIQAFGYDLSDLNDLAKTSAEAVANLQELSDWNVDDVEEIGFKAEQTLAALQGIDQSDWTVDDVDEIGKKAAEALVTLQELEEAS
jgi:hypothetical protein